MADFKTSFIHTIRNEGGYANNKADNGGETYMGIARNYWGTWKGWSQIDSIKKHFGTDAKTININAGSNPVLQAQVQEFYKANFWYPNNLQLLNDQQLANNVYDFGVNAGIGASGKRLQMAANALGCDLAVDGQVGNKTIAEVNKLSVKAVYEAFNTERKKYYDNIIAKNPSQKQFKNSWYSRITPYQNLT